jgi:hypothetical protein
MYLGSGGITTMQAFFLAEKIGKVASIVFLKMFSGLTMTFPAKWNLPFALYGSDIVTFFVG